MENEPKYIDANPLPLSEYFKMDNDPVISGGKIIPHIEQKLSDSDLLKETAQQKRNLMRENNKLTSRIAQLEADNSKLHEALEWRPIETSIPPFNTPVMFRGVITWKSKDSVSYFSDEMTDEQEILEYGYNAYLLKCNNYYLVIQHPKPEELSSEHITHWRLLNEPLVSAEQALNRNKP